MILDFLLLLYICVPHSFLFHLVFYENHWNQKWIPWVLTTIVLLIIPFILIELIQPFGYSFLN